MIVLVIQHRFAAMITCRLIYLISLQCRIFTDKSNFIIRYIISLFEPLIVASTLIFLQMFYRSRATTAEISSMIIPIAWQSSWQLQFSRATCHLTHSLCYHYHCLSISHHSPLKPHVIDWQLYSPATESENCYQMI